MPQDFHPALVSELQGVTPDHFNIQPEQAKVWQNMFAHFVFQQNGAPMEHVPDPAKGILAGVRLEDRERAIYTLAKTLGSNISNKAQTSK